MAPLSVLPGRVRFEVSTLIGCKEECLLLEEKISSTGGVTEISASHRTGRVLVRFDENLVTRSDIEGHVRRALQTVAIPGERGTVRRTISSRVASSSHAGSFVMEMALHALLPAPLDILLPAAATILRK